MKFLQNWTIILDKVPKYADFNKDFIERVDLPLAKLLLQDERIHPATKPEFAKLIQRVDKKTNILQVKYKPRHDQGRRYPEKCRRKTFRMASQIQCSINITAL